MIADNLQIGVALIFAFCVICVVTDTVRERIDHSYIGSANCVSGSINQVDGKRSYAQCDSRVDVLPLFNLSTNKL